MKSAIAILLIVFGLFGLVSGHISFTTKKEVAHIGPIHATSDETHVVWIPEAAGALALIGGVALLMMGSRRS